MYQLIIVRTFVDAGIDVVSRSLIDEHDIEGVERNKDINSNIVPSMPACINVFRCMPLL